MYDICLKFKIDIVVMKILPCKWMPMCVNIWRGPCALFPWQDTIALIYDFRPRLLFLNVHRTLVYNFWLTIFQIKPCICALPLLTFWGVFLSLKLDIEFVFDISSCDSSRFTLGIPVDTNSSNVCPYCLLLKIIIYVLAELLC